MQFPTGIYKLSKLLHDIDAGWLSLFCQSGCAATWGALIVLLLLVGDCSHRCCTACICKILHELPGSAQVLGCAVRQLPIGGAQPAEAALMVDASCRGAVIATPVRYRQQPSGRAAAALPEGCCLYLTGVAIIAPPLCGRPGDLA